jgi:hypothetical protein
MKEPERHTGHSPHMKRDRIFKHIGLHQAHDALACGWLVVMPNASMHHHVYGIVMEWLCDCKIPNTRTAST